MLARKFVLVPLAEIAATIIHPIEKNSIATCLENCTDTSEITKVSEQLTRPIPLVEKYKAYINDFEIIVVGGGHAGTEAALAAARMGHKTLLLTHNIETIGQMSCNPSIGGIGKSHLVKEVDALGGAMGVATDEAGIQFRTLNSSKGPAVRATRAQADRVLYRRAIRKRIENQTNLSVMQQGVDDLIIVDTN